MIDISQLDFSYGSDPFQLHIERFSVDEGERLALIGPSGSGKTTLLHLVAGILTPASGTIRVNDHDLSSLGDTARRAFRIANIGLVFQEFELLEYLNVLDNILLPYRITNTLLLTAKVRQRAVSLADQVGLGEKLRRRPGQLSHGERQRVAICRALVAEPKVLLADEPTGNLDAQSKLRIVELLDSFAEQNGVTLLMVTHDHSLLGQFQRVDDLTGLVTNSVDQKDAGAHQTSAANR